VRFPYVPGLLSFREAPALLAAIRKLKAEPDAFIFDGQGLAHPRRFGLACHVGVLIDRPSVGCAKSRLIGSHDDPGRRRGSSAPLVDADQRVGTVLRTRDKVKCVYVSVGHRVSLSTAERLVLACCTRYRLPEPTRLADQLVARAKNEVRT
jgi:deoxyribonuclease V